MTAYISSSRTLRNMPALFLTGYLLVYVKTFAGMTSLVSIPETLDRALLLAGCTLLLLHCLSRIHMYEGRIALIAIAIMLLAYGYLRSGETAGLVAALIVAASASLDDVRPIVRLWLYATLFATLFLAAWYLVSMSLDPASVPYAYRTEGSVTSGARWTFYFGHPNMAGATVMAVVGAALYLRYPKITMRDCLLVWCAALVVLPATDSRTSAVLIAALPVLYCLQRRYGILTRARRLLGLLPCALFFAVFLVASPLYSPPLGQLFTGRVSLWHACLENQGITLLGQEFEKSQTVIDGWRYYFNTLDSLYACGLFVLGMLFVVLFCWAYYTRFSSNDDQLGAQAPMLIVMAVFGITEVHAISPVIGFPLLFLGQVVLRRPTNRIPRYSAQ